MIKNNVLLGGLNFFSAPFGLGATASNAADSSGQTVILPPAVKPSIPQLIPTLVAGFSSFSMPTVQGFMDPKNPLNIPWNLLHQVMVSLNLTPTRPANPFADWRQETTPAETPEVEGDVAGGKSENSFFIRPVTYDNRYPGNSDPFSDLRFNGRF